ncbi:PQQ-dependent sugar dehydrogenase [Aquabacterium sp. A3]|uniref:PQQ-dependent sugar dehydrogenase n=1 Tax=Aquabacterium sp. A3 TaxID=3132829 RepID=UPI00311A2F62
MHTVRRLGTLPQPPRVTLASLIAATMLLSACEGGQAVNPADSASAAPTPVPTVQTTARPSAETLAQGLKHPWGLAILDNGEMLVTERGGQLWRLSADGQQRQPVRGVPPVWAQSQGGLLDVVADSGDQPWVYWSYAEPGTGREAGLAGTAVARGRLVGTQLQDVQVIFRQQPKVDHGNHFGSRIVLGPDNTLFIGLGDRQQDNPRSPDTRFAQNLGAHLGKVIRIQRDGSPAPGNPSWNGQAALPGIWSLGHRNIQAAALNPQTGALWVAEHGPQGGDELNIVTAGGNFGWPLHSYGCPYGSLPGKGCQVGDGQHGPGFIEPITTWVPLSMAPSGMAFYTGNRYPGWQGSLFVGALRGAALWRMTLDGDRVTGREALYEGELGRVRDVRQGPDGLLYVLTDAADDGRVIRLTPSGS